MNARPLVVRFGALGDMVILTVAIRHLQARFGQPVDVIAAAEWTAELLGDQPGVGDIQAIGSRKRPYWLSRPQQRLVRWLRERGPGPTWLFDHDNRKIESLLRRAGWTAEHWCHHEDMQGLMGSHFCDRWLRFAYRNPPILGGEDLPVGASDAHGELVVTPAQRLLVARWLQQRGWPAQRLILIQVGNKRTMRRGLQRRRSNLKYWPEENWAAVLRGLRAMHPAHEILLLGVPQEAALNERILGLASIPHAHNVVHELSIPKLIGLSELATGMVSVDTGPAHLAAAVGCSVVTLFGSTEPFMYAPRGRNARVSCLIGARPGGRSMLYIEPSEVLTAWREVVIEHATH
ncbi:MAG TPA: glycosyltransferase family 9 protein [Steroidobacteraceae bacterium]|jgi:heptosyltransferase-3|nr:glycosyltransferase family 9 protein [Steroidobacteraceae bacterium]